MTSFTSVRLGNRASRLFLAAAAALGVAACGQEQTATDPTLPGTPPSNPQLRRAAFILDVNTRTGRVKVTAPDLAVTNGLSASLVGTRGGPVRGINPSIVAGDVVDLTTSNYSASAVGAFQPGKVRVAFDVNITNRLSSIQLITPTFPVPPSGVTGILLFPFETSVTVTTGGTTVGGDGTEVLVEQPNYGQVAPSVDFDGSPFNFFNDAGCGAGSNDCYRYEAYNVPLLGTATSEARRVGFDIDPTVGSFRARIIVAADLQNSAPVTPGTVAGVVSSPERGALPGVTVTVTTGGQTGSTDGAGAYSIGGVSVGPKTVSLSNLPAGCTNPGPASTSVSSGGTSTVNFTVTCTTLTGTVAGTITSSLGGGISGVQVTVTPTGGSAEPSVSTSGAGAYSVFNVDLVGGLGTGSIALANLPAGCTNPGAQSYSGLTSGGTVTVDITVACVPPPSGYAFTNTWGAPAGGQVTLTIRLDMASYNDPAINGASADDVFAIQGATTYNAALLSFVGCSNVSGSGLSNGAFNGSTAGVVQWGNFTTAPPALGLQGIALCTFNVTGSGSVTTGTTVSVAESQNSDNLVPKILINEGTVVLP